MKNFLDVSFIGAIILGEQARDLITKGYIQTDGVSFNPGDLPQDFDVADIQDADAFVAAVNQNCGLLELYSIKGDGFTCIHTKTVVNKDFAARDFGRVV